MVVAAVAATEEVATAVVVIVRTEVVAMAATAVVAIPTGKHLFDSILKHVGRVHEAAVALARHRSQCHDACSEPGARCLHTTPMQTSAFSIF